MMMLCHFILVLNIMGTPSNQSFGYETFPKMFTCCHKEVNHKSIPYCMFVLSCLSVTKGEIYGVNAKHHERIKRAWTQISRSWPRGITLINIDSIRTTIEHTAAWMSYWSGARFSHKQLPRVMTTTTTKQSYNYHPERRSGRLYSARLVYTTISFFCTDLNAPYIYQRMPSICNLYLFIHLFIIFLSLYFLATYLDRSKHSVWTLSLYYLIQKIMGF